MEPQSALWMSFSACRLQLHQPVTFVGGRPLLQLIGLASVKQPQKGVPAPSFSHRAVTFVWPVRIATRRHMERADSGHQERLMVRKSK